MGPSISSMFVDTKVLIVYLQMEAGLIRWSNHRVSNWKARNKSQRCRMYAVSKSLIQGQATDPSHVHVYVAQAASDKRKPLVGAHKQLEGELGERRSVQVRCAA